MKKTPGVLLRALQETEEKERDCIHRSQKINETSCIKQRTIKKMAFRPAIVSFRLHRVTRQLPFSYPIEKEDVLISGFGYFFCIPKCMRVYRKYQLIFVFMYYFFILPNVEIEGSYENNNWRIGIGNVCCDLV